MDGKENLVVEKSFDFAVMTVGLCRHLVSEHKEFVLSRQLLKSGTSIGANVNEAQAAQSKADFVAKMSIASKEAREACYWLRLLCESGFLERKNSQVQSLIRQSDELTRLLTSIVKTAQTRARH